MTVDIIRLLRADHYEQDTWQNRHTTKLQNKAADEIERLRATLREIAEFNSTDGDAAYMMDVARRALGEAKDE